MQPLTNSGLWGDDASQEGMATFGTVAISPTNQNLLSFQYPIHSVHIQALPYGLCQDVELRFPVCLHVHGDLFHAGGFLGQAHRLRIARLAHLVEVAGDAGLPLAEELEGIGRAIPPRRGAVELARDRIPFGSLL